MVVTASRSVTTAPGAAGVAPGSARAVTRSTDRLVGPLFGAVPDRSAVLSFVTGGEGIVGWGEYARCVATGPDAAARIGSWFDELVARMTVDDPHGSGGPVAFVSLGFDGSPQVADSSVAIVPEVVLTRRDGQTSVTVITEQDTGHGGDPNEVLGAAPDLRSPGSVTYADDALSVAGYTTAVAEAIRRIRSGELRKVVLSHDLTATTEHPVDERFLLTALAERYPSCSAFAVDGLIGASPEMLVQRRGDQVTSLVLAGTGWAERVGDRVAHDLIASSKDQEEHRYAVDSVASALVGVCSSLDVPTAPRPLTLANLTHLASDVAGTLTAPAPTALELAAILHPTGAVGGTPTDVALRTIRELEPQPRGGYAAPVGWLDARGDGEFALALRCAEVHGRSVRLIAGGGIVADSDPDSEAREAQVKMIPIRDALEA